MVNGIENSPRRKCTAVSLPRTMHTPSIEGLRPPLSHYLLELLRELLRTAYLSVLLEPRKRSRIPERGINS